MFAPSGEFSCSFNWEWFLIFFILFIFFLFCEFRENNYCSLRGLFIWKNAPGYFVMAIYFCLGCCFWFGCFLSLSSVCRLLSHWDRGRVGVRLVLASKKTEAVGRPCSQFLVARPLTVARTLGRWHRLLLVAGLWEVIVTLIEV